MAGPIRYIERTRAYYLALGYDAPYRWASFEAVPFTPVTQRLSDLSIAIVTTAAPFVPGKGDQGPGAPYNAGAKFYDVYEGPTHEMPDLRISHIAIDRDHTTAKDIGTYFPLTALRNGDAKVAPVFFGLPTNRSHRTTARNAEDLVKRAKRHRIGAALLVPNCPVCHQSVSIAARHLEAAGIATVIMGCAKDIPEHVGVPRFVFSDFPLGNGAGRPNDTASQRQTMDLALRMLTEATQPRTTWTNPLVWPGPPDWRDDYSNPDQLSPEELARRKAAFDAGKATAKALRDEKTD